MVFSKESWNLYEPKLIIDRSYQLAFLTPGSCPLWAN